jgi:GNAT superfamily N-acetyltransferase
VWIACEERVICAVMSVEDFGEWIVADLRAAGTCPEAIPLLAGELDPSQPYRFSVRAEYWKHLQPELAEARLSCEIVALTVAPGDCHHWAGPGLVRKLTSADVALTDAYPAPAQPNEPTLSRFAEWACQSPETQVVYGLLLEDEIASYVQFGRVVDTIWEVGTIHSRENRRGQGLAKQLLSAASGELLRRGIIPLYQVNATDVASLRVAQAVGYREAFRVLGVDGRVKARDAIRPAATAIGSAEA